MLELINLSDYAGDMAMFQHDRNILIDFLRQHSLDGLEMMFCDGWEERDVTNGLIRGAHLRFWPNWIDFWQENRDGIRKDFVTDNDVIKYYGGLTPDVLTANFRSNISTAIEAGAEYAVLHVSQTRASETFTWQFAYSDQEVIDATIELVNSFSNVLPENMPLLFENLWWPGLNLLNPALIDRLLSGVNHNNVGIMLDVGHLMNTNPYLKTQAEGVRYVLEVLARMGSLEYCVKGLHLHYSLSGDFVSTHRSEQAAQYTYEQLMNYVKNVDQHRPFSDKCVQELVKKVQPEYLVHEFVSDTLQERSKCLAVQKQALFEKQLKK